jgi:hypothetical protein
MTWVATRASRFAALYGLFTPRKIVFHYIPLVAATSAGSLFTGSVWGNPLRSGDQSQHLPNTAGGVITTLRNEISINFPLVHSQKGYYVSPLYNVDSIPFTFVYTFQSTGLSAATGIGYWMMEYELELQNPVSGVQVAPAVYSTTGAKTFNATQCGAVGETRLYAYDNTAAADYYYSLATCLGDPTGDDDENFNVQKGAYYYMRDLYDVVTTQYATAKRYWGLVKRIGGALLTSRDAASAEVISALFTILGTDAPWQGV